MLTYIFLTAGREPRSQQSNLGGKSKKTAEIPPPGQATPRTRAAVAREAALTARLEAERAEIKAREAQEVAEEASRALTVLQTQPAPLQIQPPPPATPSGPNTRRSILILNLILILILPEKHLSH